MQKYRIYFFNEDGYNKPRVSIKLKGKYKSRELFIQSILKKNNNILIEDDQNETDKNLSDQLIPKQKLTSIIVDPIKSRNEMNKDKMNKFSNEGKF